MNVGLIASAVAGALVALAPLASASLLAYDGFDTTASVGAPLSTAGDNDTTGWSTANDNSGSNFGTNGWEQSVNADASVGTGLTYPGQTTSGNSAYFENASTSTEDYRQLANATTSQTLWVSFLINSATNGSSVKQELTLFDSSSSPGTASGDMMDIGLVGSSTAAWNFTNGAAGSYTPATVVGNDTYSAGITTQLVVEFIYGSTTAGNTTPGTAYLWVDPAASSLQNTTNYAATEAVPYQYNGLGLDGFRFFNNQSATTRAVGLDEIYVGTTYADVIPTPEPMALGILVPAIALLGMRRRNPKADSGPRCC